LIRVYIDADAAITRSGLETMLAADPSIEIVHDAGEADVVIGERGALSRRLVPAQIAAAVHVAAAGLLVMPAGEGPVFLPHSTGSSPGEPMTEALTAREMDVIERVARPRA